MALTDFNHTKHSTVDERGDIDVHYYKNTSEDVQIEQNVLDGNTNIPSNDHNLLALLKDLSSFAFAEKLKGENIKRYKKKKIILSLIFPSILSFKR